MCVYGQPKNLGVQPSVPHAAVRVRIAIEAAQALPQPACSLHDPALRQLAARFTGKERTRLAELDRPQSSFYAQPLPGYGDHR